VDHSAVVWLLQKKAFMDNKIQKSKLITFPRQNNLEWLRLIFAMQVVFSHVFSHLEPSFKLPGFISIFPGVPAFFFVSGFLIYSSYLNSPGKRYFENRFLRLFPALVVVTIGGGGVILFAQGWGSLLNHASTFFFWFLSQVTLGQAYNPNLFRNVGIGVINGALWTITTEILFYLSVPVIVWLEKRFRFVVVVLIIISFLIYAIGPTLLNIIVYRNKSIFDVLALTPIVWGWMFGLGIIVVKYYENIKPWMKYIPVLLIPLVGMAFWGEGVLFQPVGNRLGLVYFICYVALVLWFAFKLPVVTLPLDFSYGSYIWHGPIINLLLVLKIPNTMLAISLTLFMAALSWFLVEKPMLRFKHQSIRPV
jgi:peptidoglycan/LPS O-acetylase OafA/YrhL